jgi:hypothetical protein
MSQFPTPESIFTSSPDYPAAELIVKEMVSYINSLGEGCCQSKGNQAILNSVNPILTAMSYDAPTDLNNPVRWQTDIESSYRLLYPLT